MAEKKIVSAEELPKTKSKSNGKKTKIDIEKVKDFVVENRDTIETVVKVAGEYLSSRNSKTTKRGTKRKTTAKKTTKKTTKSDDSLSKMIDLAGTFLKK